ncbi:MAG: hypothetical protein Q9162_004689 [Coniocarpon cinnabarinum]
MAEEQQSNQVPQGLPAPPSTYRDFTTENLVQLREHHQLHVSQSQSTSEAQLGWDLSSDNVPEDLQNLIPPSLPELNDYTSFGVNLQLGPTQISSLDEYGAERLLESRVQSTHGLPSELTSNFTHLLRSIMLNFLELTNILATNPAPAPEKIEDLRILFLNAHQLLNEYRPHQARETLLEMMQDRVDGLRKQIEAVNENKRKVDELLQSVGVTNDNSLKAPTEIQTRQELQRRQQRTGQARQLWTALDKIELG